MRNYQRPQFLIFHSSLSNASLIPHSSLNKVYSSPFHDQPLDDLTFLVTGGAGFIGSNLVEYLLRYGAGRVRVLDNYSNGFRKNVRLFEGNPALEVIEGDIRDPEVCRAACRGANSKPAPTTSCGPGTTPTACP